MKRLTKIIIYSLMAIVGGWGLLTLWVEAEGGEYSWTIGNPDIESKVLIVYDPDPFYNLDKMVCTSVGEALKAENIFVTISTVAAARRLNNQTYDAYVFCANTYNWRPDWAVTNFIKQINLHEKRVFAITLGAGSTEVSRQALDKLIIRKGSKILGSHSLWLLRPNDESRLDESNVEVALSQAKAWGKDIAMKMKSDALE